VQKWQLLRYLPTIGRTRQVFVFVLLLVGAHDKLEQIRLREKQIYAKNDASSARRENEKKRLKIAIGNTNKIKQKTPVADRHYQTTDSLSHHAAHVSLRDCDTRKKRNTNGSHHPNTRVSLHRFLRL
jgi:hypothetical protein